MPSAEQLSDLALGRRLADLAGRHALRLFSAGVTARQKADRSPVTEADEQVEELIRTELAATRPGDGLLSEEGGGRARDGATGRRWIVDPIDGTHEFARGSPNWRIQLALDVGGEVRTGVVVWPALGLRWWAERGRGAFAQDGARQPRRLLVTGGSELGTARTHGTTPLPGLEPPVVEWRGHQLRNLMMAILYGQLDGCVDELGEVWDHAPYVVLVEEAGGRWSDLDGGRELDRVGGIYTNGHLHDQVLEAYQRHR